MDDKIKFKDNVDKDYIQSILYNEGFWNVINDSSYLKINEILEYDEDVFNILSAIAILNNFENNLIDFLKKQL